MEPIELSLKDQIDLFTNAAYAMDSESPLWQKGADLCLQYDIENKSDGVFTHSKSQRYLRNTIQSREAERLGLDLKIIEKQMDRCVAHHIFPEKLKTNMLADIVMSEALLYKDDVNQLLSHDDVRARIRQEYEEASPERREQNEGLKRAYERLRNYEREQIIRDGKTKEDVDIKKEIRAVLGGKLTEAVYQGIAPRKSDIPELVRKAKEKGLSADDVQKAIVNARMIAKHPELRGKNTGGRDKLADRQEKLENAGFVRKIINRKRQKDD